MLGIAFNKGENGMANLRSGMLLLWLALTASTVFAQQAPAAGDDSAELAKKLGR